MKIKLLMVFAAMCIILSVTSGSICRAESPEVTREYIVRKSYGVKSNEEKVTMDYKNLLVSDGAYMKIMFLDDADNVLDEYQTSLTLEEFTNGRLCINSEALKGTASIEIRICGPHIVENGFKLPFKIN